MNEDEYFKVKCFFLMKVVIKEERVSFISFDNVFVLVMEDGIKLQFLKIVLKEKQRGIIDVWWLYDDGGLIVLILYFLILYCVWKNCKFRFFLVDICFKYELNLQGLCMVNLLKKFCIDVSCVEQIEGVNKKFFKESIDVFRCLLVGDEFGDELIED